MDKDGMPPLEKSADCASDDDTSDGDEFVEVCGEKTVCLFCPKEFSSVDSAIVHLVEAHNINFTELQAKFKMDQYSFIKLINCIRLEGIEAQQLAEASSPFWNDDKYLKPKEYESWLSYDYEQIAGDDLEESTSALIQINPKDLQAQMRIMQQTTDSLRGMLADSTRTINELRSGFKRLVGESEGGGDGPDKAETTLNTVATTSLKKDESYFSSYAHFGIHQEMLKDTVRTTSYRNALLNNKDFVSGKDVLDVGCGTAVLSTFASQAGAKIVVGIDNSEIIYNAMEIITKNHIENVTLVKGRLEDTALPQPKYDIIISEWMGYFLLFEGMLDTVIYARDNHLREGGMLLPNRCTMSLVGCGDEALYRDHIGFWRNVYGLDMSCMQKEVIQEPLVAIVDVEHVLTEANTIAELDIASVGLDYSNFSYEFNLKCQKSGQLSSFVGYFDTYFDLPQEPVMFSTGPAATPTHWKQVIFFINEPVSVKEGEHLCGKLSCRRSRHSARSLDITIETFGRTQTYYLD